MLAEIISIGDELLIGQVINTNSSWIAEQLNLIGIKVIQITTIADVPDNIISALEEAKSRADLIITTGGLGPTKDDYTKQTFCKYFNTKLVFNEGVYNDIKELFKNRGYEVTEINKKQAEVPANCKVITNKSGTAPGMWFEKDNKVFVSLPGVPFEMKEIFTNSLNSLISEHFKTQSIYHKTVLTQGVGESFLSEIIEDWENNLPIHIKLAYLPSPGFVRLRLSAYGDDKKLLIEEVSKQIEDLKLIISEYIYGYDDDTLESIVCGLLKEFKQTLSIAESSTGGYIAHRITSVSGCSDYFLGSIVSYSNEIKINELGVSLENIIKYGAISEEVVMEMAKGIQSKYKSDYAIATSGIARSNGGSVEKPVGTTWIAIATPKGVSAKKFLFGEHLERIIQRAGITALNLLRKEILKNFDKY